MSFSIEGLVDNCIATLDNELISVYTNFEGPQKNMNIIHSLCQLKTDNPQFYNYLVLNLKICKNLGINLETISSAEKIIGKDTNNSISLEKLLTLATKGSYPTIIMNKRDKDLIKKIHELYEKVNEIQNNNV